MKHKRKILTFLLFACLISYHSFSQMGVGLSIIKPSADFAYLFKSAPALEIYFYDTDPHDQFQYSYSIGIYKFNMRNDTMPIYRLKNDGNSTTLLPGWQKVSNYFVFPLGVHSEYRFQESNFSPFAGGDLYLNISWYNNHYAIETVEELDESEVNVVFAVMPKIGVYKRLRDDLDITVGFGKAVGLDFNNMTMQSYWKIYFCLMYDGL